MAEQLGLEGGRYAVVALDRPSNADESLVPLLGALAEIARELPVLFPVHPETRARLEAPAAARAASDLILIEPLGALDFLSVLAEAKLVLTDSGRLQEETTALGIPCLTLRENTERPITVEQGTNELVGTDPGRVVAAARRALASPPQGRCPELWDGEAGVRGAEALLESA